MHTLWLINQNCRSSKIRRYPTRKAGVAGNFSCAALATDCLRTTVRSRPFRLCVADQCIQGMGQDSTMNKENSDSVNLRPARSEFSVHRNETKISSTRWL